MRASSLLHSERTGDGPRLVLVHGFTQTGKSWSRVVADLATDHEVVTVDAPGHGQSSATHADLISGARLLGDAGGRAIYIGYSMGARLCLHLALGEPALVHALVAIGANPGISDPVERARRRDDDEALADALERDGLDMFLERWLENPLFAGLDPAAADLSARRENTVTGLAASLRLAGTGTQEPLHDRLHELTMPVLLVVGQHDARFSELADLMAAKIGGNATVARVAGAGHAAHLENPVAFLSVLRTFLADVS